METYPRSHAVALRVALGLGLGFLGILLFGVAGANAADLSSGQDSGTVSEHSTPRTDHGNKNGGSSLVGHRTIDATSKLVRGTVAAVTGGAETASAKAAPAKNAPQPLPNSTTATAKDPTKAPKSSGIKKGAAGETARTATNEVRGTAATKDANKAPAKMRPTEVTAQKPRSSTTGSASEPKHPTIKAVPKTAAKPLRKTTTEVAKDVEKATTTLLAPTEAAAKKGSAAVATEPRNRPVRQALSQLTNAVVKPATKLRETSGTQIGDLRLGKTIDAVVALPAELAQPPVKETLTTITTTVDKAVARVPVVNKVLPKQLLTQTTKPVVGLVDDTADAVSAPIVSPVADVAKPILDPVAGVVKPVLGNVGDTVDPIVAPLPGVVAPIVGGTDAMLEDAAPVRVPAGQPETVTAVPVATTHLAVEDQTLARTNISASTAPAASTELLAEKARGDGVLVPDAGLPGAEPWPAAAQSPSSLGSAGPAASNETKGDAPAPQRTPAPLAAQGTGASVGSGGGPQTPLGAFQNSSFNVTPNMVSGPAVETGHQGPRGTANDPGSTPD